MKNNMIINAPVSGKTKDIALVSDPVFAQKLVGDGVAIEPDNPIITAPCDGTINHFFETNHAFTIMTDSQCEVLVHLGIDTVELKGQGFKRIIAPMQTRVKSGDPIVEMDLEWIKSQGKATDIMTIVTDSDQTHKLKKHLKKHVNPTDWIIKY